LNEELFEPVFLAEWLNYLFSSTTATYQQLQHKYLTQDKSNLEES